MQNFRIVSTILLLSSLHIYSMNEPTDEDYKSLVRNVHNLNLSINNLIINTIETKKEKALKTVQTAFSIPTSEFKNIQSKLNNLHTNNYNTIDQPDPTYIYPENMAHKHGDILPIIETSLIGHLQNLIVYYGSPDIFTSSENEIANPCSSSNFANPKLFLPEQFLSYSEHSKQNFLNLKYIHLICNHTEETALLVNLIVKKQSNDSYEIQTLIKQPNLLNNYLFGIISSHALKKFVKAQVCHADLLNIFITDPTCLLTAMYETMNDNNTDNYDINIQKRDNRILNFINLFKAEYEILGLNPSYTT